LHDVPEIHGRKALVISNPMAGSRRTTLTHDVIHELSIMGWQVSLVRTQSIGHAEQIVVGLQAQPHGMPDVLIVAGGDGTINEVVNGLCHIGGLDLPIALIPTGTVNLLASEIRLPTNPKLLADIISQSRVGKVVLGQITAGPNSRLFLMTAGVGFDARAVSRVSKNLKKFDGKFAYIVAGVTEYLFGKWPFYQITIDGESSCARSVLFANGRHYAGGMTWAPGASIKEPSLEVGVFHRLGRFRLLLYALALIMGKLGSMPGVRILSAKEIELQSHCSDPIQADGDIVGYLPARISVAPTWVNMIGLEPRSN